MMTPKEFAKRMRAISAAGGDTLDLEDAHIDMDILMEELLIDLGYREGIEIFRRMEKWYA